VRSPLRTELFHFWPRIDSLAKTKLKIFSFRDVARRREDIQSLQKRLLLEKPNAFAGSSNDIRFGI